jgi:hypothetical protein
MHSYHRGQTLPQAPQLLTSLERFLQAEPHAVRGDTQFETHAPPTAVLPSGHAHWKKLQLAPTGQALPQAPQLDALVLRSKQPPLQLVVGAVQANEDAAMQVALEHISPAAQALPQAPQLDALEARFTHAPSQLTCPEVPQVCWQEAPAGQGSPLEGDPLKTKHSGVDPEPPVTMQ